MTTYKMITTMDGEQVIDLFNAESMTDAQNKAMNFYKNCGEHKVESISTITRDGFTMGLILMTIK